MMETEAQEGRVPVTPLAKPKWLNPRDWTVWPVLSVYMGELHIVAVASARKGALRRLIDGARADGLSPVVVCPMGPTMPAILAKWGWKERIVGEGWERREEWRPA